VDLHVQHDSAALEFSAELSGSRSILQYRYSDGVMTILHTKVPEVNRGRGVGAQLMRAALALAREKGWKVNPACSYALAFMRREPQYADLLFDADAERKHADALLDEALDESFPASDVPSIGGDD
jgi:predicted GNAT family acetyltransferase